MISSSLRSMASSSSTKGWRCLWRTQSALIIEISIEFHAKHLWSFQTNNDLAFHFYLRSVSVHMKRNWMHMAYDMDGTRENSRNSLSLIALLCGTWTSTPACLLFRALHYGAELQVPGFGFFVSLFSWISLGSNSNAFEFQMCGTPAICEAVTSQGVDLAEFRCFKASGESYIEDEHKEMHTVATNHECAYFNACTPMSLHCLGVFRCLCLHRVCAYTLEPSPQMLLPRSARRFRKQRRNIFWIWYVTMGWRESRMCKPWLNNILLKYQCHYLAAKGFHDLCTDTFHDLGGS